MELKVKKEEYEQGKVELKVMMETEVKEKDAAERQEGKQRGTEGRKGRWKWNKKGRDYVNVKKGRTRRE